MTAPTKLSHPSRTAAGVMYVGSVEAILLGMFGPQQHDAHVGRYRNELWFLKREAAHRRANAAAAAEVDSIIAGWRAAQPQTQAAE